LTAKSRLASVQSAPVRVNQTARLMEEPSEHTNVFDNWEQYDAADL